MLRFRYVADLEDFLCRVYIERSVSPFSDDCCSGIAAPAIMEGVNVTKVSRDKSVFAS